MHDPISSKCHMRYDSVPTDQMETGSERLGSFPKVTQLEDGELA